MFPVSALDQLPRSSINPLHAVRTMSRGDLQTIMDFLLDHYVREGTHEGRPMGKISIREVSDHTGISKASLYRYIDRLERDPTFNPKDLHKGINTSMSEKMELELVMEIEQWYIIPGFYFNNRILKVLAMGKWYSSPPEDKLRSTFRASSRWCRNFRKRHNYVWRKAKAVRKALQTPKTLQLKENFIADITRLIKEHEQNGELDLIVNVDETSWKLCYAGELTWAKKGASSVKISVAHNTKECLTSIASMTASGEKLPLYILAKGKTKACERNQIAGVPGFSYATDHSPTGWTTSTVMVRYLHWLRSIMDQSHKSIGKTIHLVLDTYRAHLTDEVKNTADSLQIKLHYIPAGCTESLQPLDIKVFGALKAKARGYWYTHHAMKPREKHTKLSAVKTLLCCWDELNKSVISNAWAQYRTLLQMEEDDDNAVSHLTNKSIEQIRTELKTTLVKLTDLNYEKMKSKLNDFNVSDADEDEEQSDQNDVDDHDQHAIVEEEEDNDDEYEYTEDEIGDSNDIQIPPPLTLDAIRPIVTDINHPQFHVHPRSCRVSILHTMDHLNQKLHIIENYENMLLSLKYASSLHQKKKPPDIIDTVGINNIGNSCAFNAFIQIFQFVPEHHHEERDPMIISERIQNFAMHFLNHFKHSTTTVCMNSYLRLQVPQRVAHHIRGIICNQSQSVITYITDCIKMPVRSFIHNGGITSFLSVDSTRSLDYNFNGIDPSSLNQYLFTSVRDPSKQEGNMFPFQIQLDNHSYRAVLILKAFITNPNGNHFVTYIRRKFSSDFIRVDDDEVIIAENLNLAAIERKRIGMYYVIKTRK